MNAPLRSWKSRLAIGAAALGLITATFGVVAVTANADEATISYRLDTEVTVALNDIDWPDADDRCTTTESAPTSRFTEVAYPEDTFYQTPQCDEAILNVSITSDMVDGKELHVTGNASLYSDDCLILWSIGCGSKIVNFAEFDYTIPLNAKDEKRDFGVAQDSDLGRAWVTLSFTYEIDHITVPAPKKK